MRVLAPVPLAVVANAWWDTQDGKPNNRTARPTVPPYRKSLIFTVFVIPPPGTIPQNGTLRHEDQAADDDGSSAARHIAPRDLTAAAGPLPERAGQSCGRMFAEGELSATQRALVPAEGIDLNSGFLRARRNPTAPVAGKATVGV